MRCFQVLVAMEIHAESFAGAEKTAHRVMGEYFNASDGDNPKSFQTISIVKGQKVNQ